jgi:hypothetical protein
VYEGLIDDPYGEFFIAENKYLQKVGDARKRELRGGGLDLWRIRADGR